MTVAINNDLGAGKRLMELGRIGTTELIAVRHYDLKTIQLDLGDLRQLRPDVEPVAVAVHGRHGRERAQLDEQVAAPDVAPMEDVIDFAKDVEHLRPQHAVGVRDDAQPHGTLRAVT